MELVLNDQPSQMEPLEWAGVAYGIYRGYETAKVEGVAFGKQARAGMGNVTRQFPQGLRSALENPKVMRSVTTSDHSMSAGSMKSLSFKRPTPMAPKRERSFGSGKYSGVVKQARHSAKHRLVKLRMANVVPAGQWGMSHQGELKFKDTAVAGNLPTVGKTITTGGATFIDIEQGTTVGKRVGNKAWLSKLMFKGTLSYNPGASGAAGSVATVYLVQDMQANGANAGVSAIFEGTDLSSALHNLTNSKRFRVIHKEELALNCSAGDGDGTYGKVIVPFSFYVDWPKGLEIYYNGTAGLIGERTSNSLMLFGGSTENNLMTLTGNMRVRYRD